MDDHFVTRAPGHLHLLRQSFGIGQERKGQRTGQVGDLHRGQEIPSQIVDYQCDLGPSFDGAFRAAFGGRIRGQDIGCQTAKRGKQNNPRRSPTHQHYPIPQSRRGH